MIDLVMLIDDNDTDNFISKRIIELTQFARQVEAQNSGQGALDYLQQYQDKPEKLPDLIFLDINMPIVDGFMFLYEFENLPQAIQNKCKVVILSSSDNQRDINRLINNEHVIKYVTKPLTQLALDEIRNL
jgi:CheY-like chemotaxis protein